MTTANESSKPAKATRPAAEKAPKAATAPKAPKAPTTRAPRATKMAAAAEAAEPAFASPQPSTPAAAPQLETAPQETAQPQPAPQPQPQPAYVRPAPMPMLESEARTMAMLSHFISAVASLLTAGTLAVFAPMAIWIMYKDRSALVASHGKQNLNLQLTNVVIGAVAFFLGFVAFFGLGWIVTMPLAGLYWLYSIIISFVAGAKANDGLYYEIPAVIRFIR